jgi:hypothetical protein
MPELSTVIDSLRGVFKNVPGSGVGLYPYEPIKDIQEIVEWVHEGKSAHVDIEHADAFFKNGTTCIRLS